MIKDYGVRKWLFDKLGKIILETKDSQIKKTEEKRERKYITLKR